MKKLFLTLCLLSLCFTLSDAGITDKLKSVIARKSVAVGGAGTWYYHPDTTTEHTWDSTADMETTYAGSVRITVPSNGYVTQIGISLADIGGGGDIKMALYENDDSHHETIGATAAVGSQWNDFTLVAALAVSASDIVKVVGIGSVDSTIENNRLSTPGTSYYGECAYASFPCGVPATDDSVRYGYRICFGAAADSTCD